MGLYPQPNDWTCGPFALKHALVSIGQMADPDTLRDKAHTHWWSGTDEIGLARAARHYRCELVHERTLNPDTARRLLLAHLRENLPALLCVDDWGHWVTAVRHTSSRFVVIDSDADPVLSALTWQQLERRWRYRDTEYDQEDPPRVYDFLALRPLFRVRVRANFSLQRIKHLRRSESRSLAKHWDEYLADLLEICRPRSTNMSGAQTVGEFLRRNQELLLSRVIHWHGFVERQRVARFLGNMRFVAETYGLVIPKSLERQARTDLAVLTTLVAAAMGGVDEGVYGIDEM